MDLVQIITRDGRTVPTDFGQAVALVETGEATFAEAEVAAAFADLKWLREQPDSGHGYARALREIPLGDALRRAVDVGYKGAFVETIRSHRENVSAAPADPAPAESAAPEPAPAPVEPAPSAPPKVAPPKAKPPAS